MSNDKEEIYTSQTKMTVFSGFENMILRVLTLTPISLMFSLITPIVLLTLVFGNFTLKIIKKFNSIRLPMEIGVNQFRRRTYFENTRIL